MRSPLLAVCLAVACRRASGAPASPLDAAAQVADAARGAASFLRPAGCGYVTQPPHAGSLEVRQHAEVYGSQARPRNLHLTFVGDPSSSLVVQWGTDLETLASKVSLREEGGAAFAPFTGYSFPLRGARGRRQHEVHLCGLRPSTRYRYVVEGGAPSTSSTHTFTTAPAKADEVRAAVAGDARTDPRTWGRIARAMLAKRPDVFLFTGDAVADGGALALWDAFFDASGDLFAEVPVILTDGNHEGRAAVYYDQFALPVANEVEWDEHWFALTYGPLRVITLNDTTESDADIVGEEVDFLHATLRSVDRARTPWVVTMHHQPMYTDSSGHRPLRLTRDAWGPIFDRYHVDLDLSGHVHNYESSEPIRDGQVVDPVRGTRYLIFGGAGAPLYGFRARESWVHHREQTHGFGVLTASATALRWEAFRDDGSVIEALDLAHHAP